MSKENTANERPTIDTSTAKEILRVAYLLSAIDGEICDREKAKFMAFMRMLFGERYVDPDVISYLEEMSREAKKLIELRSFYANEEEILKVFMTKSADSVAKIMINDYFARCAFVMWIGICMADTDYSDLERSAVKQLQQLANNIGIGTFATTVSGSGAMFGLFRSSAAATRTTKRRDCITDRFLTDVERRLKRIGELHAKMQAATAEDMRQNYKDMYDFEVSELVESQVVK